MATDDTKTPLTDALTDEFKAAGYTDDHIQAVLAEQNRLAQESQKTTWIRVHRRHLLPETLDAYRLPWEWDQKNVNYLIIKQWISQDFQEELFAHTRRLGESKHREFQNTLVEPRTTEQRGYDWKKDQMYLVRKRKKGASGRDWVYK